VVKVYCNCFLLLVIIKEWVCFAIQKIIHRTRHTNRRASPPNKPLPARMNPFGRGQGFSQIDAEVKGKKQEAA
jgi:hypothetical protein